MFEYEVDILNNGWVRKFRLIRHAERLCYSDVLDLWQRDEPFRSFFISLLAEAPFSAYRWETPPVSCGTVNRTAHTSLATQTRRHSQATSTPRNRARESLYSTISVTTLCSWFPRRRRVVLHTPISQHSPEVGQRHRPTPCGRSSAEQCRQESQKGRSG
jgi:hypothetical protein